MEVSYGLGYFGDIRRATSGYVLHKALVEAPGCCIKALGKTRAGEMQLRRFLSCKEVTLKEMVEQAACDTARLAQGRHVLVLQDSSDLVFGGKKARAAGFGPVGKGGALSGLCLHAGLAVDASNRRMLGLVELTLTNRFGDRKVPARWSRSLHEHESQRWLDGAQAASRVLTQAAGITVEADRESDIYQGYADRPANVHLLSRVHHDRRIVNDAKAPQFLHAFGDALAVSRTVLVTIPAAPGRKKRRARLELRFGPVTLRRPKGVKAKDAPACLSLNLVDIREVGAPADVDPVHWRLLTTHAVDTVGDGLRMLAFYRCRWLIEEYFKVLKSGGMDIENALIEKPDAMIKLTGAAAIAAVTIMKLKQARDGLTDEGFETVFEQGDEPLLEALSETLEGHTQKQKNPHPRRSLAWAQWVIARLGGWSCYYGKPGPKTYQKGLAKFYDIKLGAQLAQKIV
jgi:hypothetical protein